MRTWRDICNDRSGGRERTERTGKRRIWKRLHHRSIEGVIANSAGTKGRRRKRRNVVVVLPTGRAKHSAHARRVRAAQVRVMMIARNERDSRRCVASRSPPTMNRRSVAAARIAHGACVISRERFMRGECRRDGTSDKTSERAGTRN